MDRLNWAKQTCFVLVLCAAAAIALPAQTFTTLFSFDSTDGAQPEAGLVQATDGNLYGTTFYGGTYDGGTVFKIAVSGTLTTLYSFCPFVQDGCHDGHEPLAALVQATNGNFYGTTLEGAGSYHWGTVFKITPSGSLKTLYNFVCKPPEVCADGAYPDAGLVEAANGNFYGTTSGSAPPYTYGTIFKITPGGTLTTLYSFCSRRGCTDGEYPTAGLVQATDGSFYGTTFGGGANSGGTVFKINPRGTLTTLYSFCSQSGCTDGSGPQAGLAQATDGNFYGTTYSGGANGSGTIFKITPSGMLTTLYSFCSQSGCADGANPVAGLIQATDGNLYGTTRAGGANVNDTICPDGCGTVFKITPTGTLAALYSLCSQSGCADGSQPYAGLVQDTNGNFYGTTSYGGVYSCIINGSNQGCGTTFSVSVGLGPFVETQPTSGKVGKAVNILGTNLTAATSVTFNGTAATFTVVSSSLITTTVPAGAITGTVQVVTPGGTLSSNVPFRVLP